MISLWLNRWLLTFLLPSSFYFFCYSLKQKQKEKSFVCDDEKNLLYRLIKYMLRVYMQSHTTICKVQYKLCIFNAFHFLWKWTKIWKKLLYLYIHTWALQFIPFIIFMPFKFLSFVKQFFKHTLLSAVREH